MEVEVETREGKRKVEIGKDATGENLLALFGMMPDLSLIVVDGKPIPYTEKIIGKKIKIINVATGG
jgi:sulfur carrier protein ThiS